MLLSIINKGAGVNKTPLFIRHLKLMNLKELGPSVHSLLNNQIALKALLKRTYRFSHTLQYSENNTRQKNVTAPYESNRLQEKIMLDIITFGKALSDEEVVKFKTNVLTHGKTITEYNIDAVFLTKCAVEKAMEVGRSYFLHLFKTQAQLNIASAGKFFRLCYSCKDICTEEDKQLIIDVYKELITRYKILDSNTCENALLGLSITREWKEGLKLMEMCELSSKPTSKMDCALIIASFKNKNTKLGWKLIESALQNNRTLNSEVYSFCILTNNGKDVDFFFELLKNYNVQISEESGDVILQSYRTVKSSKGAKISTITNKGLCLNCGKSLQNVHLTNSEFEELKKQFLNPVLIGKNVFLKTKPVELNNFFNFIKKIGRVDVVLDGLNVAYAAGKKKSDIYNRSQLLYKVVDHFVKMGQQVLIIGRKHMTNWPSRNMNFIKKNSLLFLTDDVSADDPFILYAAMSSGLGTIFISRDQMRSHRFLLQDSKIHTSFIKWQQLHQYYLKYVTPDGTVILQNPLPYLINIQKGEDGSWHFPINPSSELKSGVPAHLLPQKTSWLCLPSTA